MKAEEFIEAHKEVIDLKCEEGKVIANRAILSEQEALEALKIAHNDAVKKWSLWCFNYSTPFERTICHIFGGMLSVNGNGKYCCKDNHFTQHLIEKWQSFENRGDARMLLFYCELDSGLRKQLVDWVMENYRG